MNDSKDSKKEELNRLIASFDSNLSEDYNNAHWIQKESEGVRKLIRKSQRHNVILMISIGVLIGLFTMFFQYLFEVLSSSVSIGLLLFEAFIVALIVLFFAILASRMRCYADAKNFLKAHKKKEDYSKGDLEELERIIDDAKKKTDEIADHTRTFGLLDFSNEKLQRSIIAIIATIIGLTVVNSVNFNSNRDAITDYDIVTVDGGIDGKNGINDGTYALVMNTGEEYILERAEISESDRTLSIYLDDKLILKTDRLEYESVHFDKVKRISSK